jgi:hypothetical protein
MMMDIWVMMGELLCMGCEEAEEGSWVGRRAIGTGGTALEV